MSKTSYTEALEHVDVHSVEETPVIVEEQVEEAPVVKNKSKKSKTTKVDSFESFVFGAPGDSAYISESSKEKIISYISSYSGCHLTYAPLSGLIDKLEPKTSSTYAYAFDDLMWNIPAGAGQDWDTVAAYIYDNLI